MIARKVRRVELDAVHIAGEPELDEGPVVAREPPPPRLPPVHHLAKVVEGLRVKMRCRRLEHVVGRRKPLVGREENVAAEASVGQVGQPVEFIGEGWIVDGGGGS